MDLFTAGEIKFCRLWSTFFELSLAENSFPDWDSRFRFAYLNTICIYICIFVFVFVFVFVYLNTIWICICIFVFVFVHLLSLLERKKPFYNFHLNFHLKNQMLLNLPLLFFAKDSFFTFILIISIFWLCELFRV